MTGGPGQDGRSALKLVATGRLTGYGSATPTTTGLILNLLVMFKSTLTYVEGLVTVYMRVYGHVVIVVVVEDLRASCSLLPGW